METTQTYSGLFAGKIPAKLGIKSVLDFLPFINVSEVPVLPAMRYPGIFALYPEPSLTTSTRIENDF